MLQDLAVAMERHHRRRLAQRRIALPIAVALLAAGAIWAMTPRRPHSQVVERAPIEIETLRAPRPAAEIAFVETDPAILERFLIDDDALIETLALIDRPAGLIRCGQRAWLTADVTDKTPPG
jgi:hypothetical protein